MPDQHSKSRFLCVAIAQLDCNLDTDIKKRLEDEIRNIASSEVFAQRSSPAAIEVRYLDAVQFSEFLRSENARWSKIVEARKIKVEQ